MVCAAMEVSDVTYRPDIDGLRAVAVLAVIGFHAGIRVFAGGYVGVDIFFVISGFLITSIICKKLERGKFSFWDFYARRAKRIFPALIVVLLVVCAYGYFILLPNEFERLGKHVSAGAGFVSNFVSWKESGYFDKAAEVKPLLHLWSLGIEEQFYLLWPPLLVWAWRRKTDVFGITCTIVGISFVINVSLVSLWQAAETYYLPPTRFWELLLGGALAYGSLFRKEEFENAIRRLLSFLPLEYRSIVNIQSAAGLLLILIAVVALNQTMLFPGWWALLPTAGTTLLIWAGPGAWINRRLLSSRPLVFIGLISYPLYLWHWPLLSYAHIVEPGVLAGSTVAAAVALAFVLAWLTFRVIEKPLRSKSNTWAFPCIASIVLVACLGLAVFCHQIHARSQSYGFDRIVAAETGNWDFPGSSLKPFHTALGYHFERGSSRSKVLFVGDSHVQQYYPRIDRLLTEHPDRTRSVAFVAQLGCPPISYIDGWVHPKCKGLIENAFAVADDLNVDTVVIGAAWPRYVGPDSGGSDTPFFQALATTIRRFRDKGRRVFLILPIPRGDVFAPSQIVKRSFGTSGFTVIQRIQRSEVERLIKPVSAKLIDIAASSGAKTIDPLPDICSAAECPTLAEDGLPLYCDGSHLRSDFVREHMTFLDDIVLIENTPTTSDLAELSGHRLP
jgi:peptidoglycan/LPS O-acetylase OafA/YrhL